MFMHRIRHATRKHRKVLLIVIIIIAVGIVGSFAVWNSNSANQNQQNTSYADLADQCQEYIASIEPESMEGMEYDAAIELAEYYYTLYSYALYAYYESGDETYNQTSIDAMKSSADYFTYAAENFTYDLESADYDASIENYSNYITAGNLYQGYASMVEEGEEAEALYQSSLESADLWLDHALSVSDADLASADYDTAMDLYNRYTQQYQLKYTLLGDDENADQSAYIAAMENAYAWSGRMLDAYDPNANANEEEGIEGDSPLTQANTLYSIYQERFTLANTIADATGDESYQAEYLANMEAAYTQLETIGQLSEYDMETADASVANEATSLYDTLASLCDEIVAAGGDSSYTALGEQHKQTALEWYTAYIDKGTDYTEAQLSELYTDLADRYMELGQTEKAGEQLKKAAEAYPSFADPLLAYAEYLNEYESTEAAIEALTAGLENMEEGSDDQISVQLAIEEYQGE